VCGLSPATTFQTATGNSQSGAEYLVTHSIALDVLGMREEAETAQTVSMQQLNTAEEY
jgi:hypothetical protein